MGSKKKYEFRNKKGTQTFFWPNIVLKKSMRSKKSMGSQKKGTHTFGHLFAGIFFCLNWISVETKKTVPAKSVFPCTFFFCFNWFSVQTEKSTGKKSTQKYEFLFLTHTCFGAHTFFGTLFGPKKVWVPSFFGTHTLFWSPCFFLRNIWNDKSMSSFFWGNRTFLKTHTVYFGTMFGTEKVWVPFFLEPILFLAQCWARKKYECLFSFLELILFLAPILFLALYLGTEKVCVSFFFELILFLWHSSFFLQYVGPKKYEFLFCWNSYFFFETHTFFQHNMLRPKKVWVPPFFSGISSFFLALHTFFGTMFCPKKVSMSSFLFWNPYFFLAFMTFSGTMLGPKKVWVPFFWNSIRFFGTHTFIGTMFGTEKVWVSFFWDLILSLDIHTFFWHNVWPEKVGVPSFFGTHTFFDAMFGLKKYESCLFPELLVFFFGAVISLMNKMFGFLRDAFFPVHLTLNTFVVELSLFLRRNGHHFMGLLSFGDFKFLWPCVVCLFHFFDFCWVLLFPKLFSWNRFFSRI